VFNHQSIFIMYGDFISARIFNTVHELVRFLRRCSGFRGSVARAAQLQMFEQATVISLQTLANSGGTSRSQAASMERWHGE
jgi:hypothetical protein